MKYDDSYDVTLEEKKVNINNSSLTWKEAITKFFTDLPSLADEINTLTEEVDGLF